MGPKSAQNGSALTVFEIINIFNFHHKFMMAAEILKKIKTFAEALSRVYSTKRVQKLLKIGPSQRFLR